MTRQELDNMVKESLRDWFKKEKWVRISTSGNIAGPCGTSKNKKNPDRCLPKAKAQSLTKAQRAATARKKKKAGAKGKTVVKNTKAATVKREHISESLKSAIEKEMRANDGRFETPFPTRELRQILNTKDHNELGDSAKKVLAKLKKKYKLNEKLTKEDVRNLVVGTLYEMQNEGTITEKDDRCTRIAKRKYDTWPSAYASGAVVRCRRGEIWKGVKEEVIQESDCKHGRYFCNHDKKYKCRKGPKKSR